MRRFLLGLISTLLLTPAAFAQGLKSDLFQLKDPVSQIRSAPKVEISAVLVPAGQPGVFQLQVKMVLPEGSNSYSQDPDFPKPTKITVNGTGWTPIDSTYTITPPPKKEHDENFEKVVEKIFGTAVFSRRFTAPPGTTVSNASLTGKIDFLLCDKNNCRPQSAEFTAAGAAPRREDADTSLKEEAKAASEEMKLSSDDQPTATAVPKLSLPGVTPVTIPSMKLKLPKTASVSPEESAAPTIAQSADSAVPPLAFGYEVIPQPQTVGGANPARLQFELAPAQAQPGEIVTVAITMTLEDNWSTYGLEKADSTQIETPTSIKFEPTNLKMVGSTVSVPPPQVHTTKLQNEVRRSNAYEHFVTWKQEFEVASAGPFGVDGSIRYQICKTGQSCLPPRVVKFSLGETQKADQLVAAMPIVTSYINATNDDITPLKIEAVGEEVTLWGAMLTSFFAGLLMNVLPCVLPVLAIKILSFAQQGGESRARIFGLNLAYTAGVVAVFMVLAVISVVLKQSISVLYQSNVLMIVMSCVVFVMALSLFGVFELPVPGLIPSANHHREGYLGAVNTGVIATLIGTPCIGPFIAPVFTWSLGQPTAIVFGMFGLMGLGMASPFLLTACFPGLIRHLPQPGMWMVKFKQFCGFVMMATVIFLMYSVDDYLQLPVLVLMLALALMVWLAANLSSPAEPFRRQLKGYLYAVTAAAPVFLTGLLLMQESRIPWQPFSEAELVKLRTEGRPVLIDFTADWCVVCKVNERIAIEREETIQFLKSNDIVAMKADFTKESPEILKYLRQFGQDGPPLTIIIPPGQDSKLIALRGQYTQGILMEKLQEAMGTATSSDSTVTAAVPSGEKFHEPDAIATK